MMKETSIFWLAVHLLTLSLLAGCGGGSDGTSGVAIQPTTATLTLYTQGTFPPDDQGIAGVAATVTLPPGVTVQTDANGVPNGGVVAPSGVTAGKAIVNTIFTPATATTAAKLSLTLASTEPAGFGVGEFATINCSVSAGNFPKATDFSLSNTNITGLLTFASLTTLSITNTADIK